MIRVQEGSRNAIEADYALVRFTLPYEHEISHGDLYVFGQISDYGFPESHRMTYNAEKTIMKPIYTSNKAIIITSTFLKNMKVVTSTDS